MRSQGCWSFFGAIYRLKSAKVGLGAVGFPGSLDGYQVNFRVPPGTAKGVATIQVTAAWIAGTAVGIAVQ